MIDFIKTDYDREVDNKSLLVNSFTFEKYFAGKYIGEIVRVVLVKLVQNGILFDGTASEKLLAHGAFTARHLSIIEEYVKHFKTKAVVVFFSQSNKLFLSFTEIP